MNNIIEIDDRLVVPPPWASILHESKKVPGEMDAHGRFQAHHSTKPLIEKMVAANMLPPIVNPADMYVSRGEYQPWAHQRLIMRLYTAHTRAYNYADLGCVDEKTEYLSPEGWRYIKHYDGGLIAVDVDPYGNPVWGDPIQYVSAVYEGYWIHIENDDYDQMLTPDHRVPVVSDNYITDTIVAPARNKGHFNYTLGSWGGFIRAKNLLDDGGKGIMLAGACAETVESLADGLFRRRFLLQEPGHGRLIWTARHAAHFVSAESVNRARDTLIEGRTKKYCFTTHTGVWLMRRNGKVAVTGNSGKTNGSLWAFDLLKSLGRVDKLLVITPLSTVDAAWGEDAKNSVPHLSMASLIGTKARRVSILEKDRHDIYVINHDGAKTIEKPLIDWCKRHKVMTVYDEATAIKLYTTARSKTARHIFNASARRYVMTATPVVQTLMDAHGLLTAIDNVEFPRALTAFKQEFFVLAGPHKWVPKMTSFERLQTLMSPAIRLNTRDLIDLPENVLVRKWPPLTPEQDAAYRQMEETLVYEHDPSMIVTAANAAVKMGKLIQVTCGIMHAEDTTITFDPKNKLTALEETIDESRSKVLIFAPYTAVIDRLVQYLEERFYPGCTAIIDGRVPGNKRGDIVRRFQDPNDPLLYIVAHPRAASHGLTLTEADTTVWFAPYLSAESFVQANARIDRPGQKRTTRTVMLASTDLERDLYKTLLSKKSANNEFVEIYNALISDVAKRTNKGK